MKNITKKIATALLAAIIAASFAACSGSTDDDDSEYGSPRAKPKRFRPSFTNARISA